MPSNEQQAFIFLKHKAVDLYNAGQTAASDSCITSTSYTTVLFGQCKEKVSHNTLFDSKMLQMEQFKDIKGWLSKRSRVLYIWCTPELPRAKKSQYSLHYYFISVFDRSIARFKEETKKKKVYLLNLRCWGQTGYHKKQ